MNISKKINLSGSNSSKEMRKAVEECLLSSSSTLDVSRRNIKHLTEEMHRLPNIKYFPLEGNAISTILQDLFQKLPRLVWLDLWCNKIRALPPGISYHRVKAIDSSAFREESNKRATCTAWTIRAKRAGKCRLEAEKELKEEQAVFEQRKNNKEMLWEWCSQAELVKEKEEMFGLSPTNAVMRPKNASHATDGISYGAVKEGAVKQDCAPDGMQERLLKVRGEATRSLRENKLEHCIKLHRQTMKARGEKLKGASQVGLKAAKQDTETAAGPQTTLAKAKGGLPLREFHLVAFTGEPPPGSPRSQTQRLFSSSQF